jgi:hypothetical protein
MIVHLVCCEDSNEGRVCAVALDLLEKGLNLNGIDFPCGIKDWACALVG